MKYFFLGFLVAMAGICLISFSSMKMELNPAGDILALIAALVWGGYSVFTKKINDYGYHIIQAARRTFFYGILFMIPALFFFDFKLDFQRFTVPVNLFNMLYLGLGASALCFVTWSSAVKVLGAMKTSIYIYLVPVITVITSVLILDERITRTAAAGTILTLIGLVVSEYQGRKKEETI